MKAIENDDASYQINFQLRQVHPLKREREKKEALNEVAK